MLPARSNSEFLLYQSDDGKVRIQVRLEDNTVWLTQADMVELFQSSKSNISEHIKHIFEEGELQEDSVVRNFRTTAADGKISAELAKKKAEAEYELYKKKSADELSEVDKQFIASIEQANKKLKSLKSNKKK